ncbi:sphingomyelin phosphodiesterase [Anaeramoeba flamelloides]|uniref:Sphingomyelin phosphodiesterase n=1 Tax=Anaeramoeba flamelloides TaxID=1746091 RepID=A0ABQ8YI49_9EUKA|nr:sphingomyelin phosphodiesterase [Anaeramoeba flamelloides]
MKTLSSLLLLLILISCVFSSTLKLLLVTDAHSDPQYYEGADQDDYCRKGKGKAGKYGSTKKCDIPYLTFHSALKFAGTLDPDVVIYLGDMMPHKIEYTESEFQSWFLNTTQTLKNSFPNVKKIFFTLGNNDFFVHDDAPPVSDMMYINAANFWSPWLSTDSYQRVQNGGFYSELIPGTNVRVVSMNSILWFEENEVINSDDVDPWGQLNWLSETLDKSYANNEKVWFMTHLPIGMKDSSDRYWKKRFQKSFLQLVRKYAYSANGEKMITAMFSGHHHMDQFEMVYDQDVYPHTGDEKPLLVNMVISALESRKSKTNPSLRLAEFETESGMLVSYDQWFMDINQANTDRVMDWNLRYSAGELGVYGLDGLGPDQFNDFVKNLKNSNSLAQKYFQNQSEGLVTDNCDQSCIKQTVCLIEYITKDECQKCLDD